MTTAASTLFEKGMMEKVPSRTTSLMTDGLEQGFLNAFDEYADALFRHAVLRVSDRERARDLVQDTFTKVWDHVHSGKEVQHWRGFLYRILNNLIVDEYRKKHEVSLDALLEDELSFAEPLLATGSRIEEESRLDDAILIERIRVFIPQLPEPYRVAITLRYVDGFTPKEIAGLLEISENVASVRIHRAVEKLNSWCAHLNRP